MKFLKAMMMSCEEFRERTGADPRHEGPGQWMHRMMCKACRGYAGEMLQLDRRIERATRAAVAPPQEPPMPPRS